MLGPKPKTMNNVYAKYGSRFNNAQKEAFKKKIEEREEKRKAKELEKMFQRAIFKKAVKNTGMRGVAYAAAGASAVRGAGVRSAQAVRTAGLKSAAYAKNVKSKISQKYHKKQANFLNLRAAQKRKNANKLLQNATRLSQSAAAIRSTYGINGGRLRTSKNVFYNTSRYSGGFLPETVNSSSLWFNQPSNKWNAHFQAAAATKPAPRSGIMGLYNRGRAMLPSMPTMPSMSGYFRRR